MRKSFAVASAVAGLASFATFGLTTPYIPVPTRRAPKPWKTAADHERLHKAILKRARKANELRYLASIGAIGSA